MKKSYGNRGPKNNIIAAHIKKTNNLDKMLKEAMRDGIAYGILAMEVFDTAYHVCFGYPAVPNLEQTERRNRMITNFKNEIVDKYVPIAEVPELLYQQFNLELEESYKIFSVKYFKDFIVNTNPKLGAYF